MTFQWSAETYEASISNRCWMYIADKAPSA